VLVNGLNRPRAEVCMRDEVVARELASRIVIMVSRNIGMPNCNVACSGLR
jgi:hypothetical protein